jgi:hypothetical protein
VHGRDNRVMLRRVGLVGLLVFCLGLVAPLSSVDAKRSRRHTTCGTFCRQAGGLGGNPGIPPCKVLSSVIRVSNSVAAVKVRCFGRDTSRGAVAIYPHDFGRDSVNDGVPPGSYGGADLVCPPHRTVTLHILLSRKSVALLTRRHALRVDVLVELDTKPVVQANTRANVRLVPVAGTAG